MPSPVPASVPQFDINRSGELEVFVQVAEKGSFSAAARQLGVSPSAVSKIMARLEARLGAQLLLRSTRRLPLGRTSDNQPVSSSPLVPRTRQACGGKGSACSQDKARS